MKRAFRLAALLCAATAFALPASAASTSFDFLFNVQHVSDDGQLFLNLTVGSYNTPRTVLEPALPRLHMVDQDLPVVLFLSERCQQSPDALINLRARGLSWAVVFERVRVPMDVLFAGMERDPGPPYGHAWGYWRKRGRRVRLIDDDVRALVRLQVGSRITGIGVMELAQRSAAQPVPYLVAERHGRPWVAAREAHDDHDRGLPPGHGGLPPGHGGVPPGQAKKGD